MNPLEAAGEPSRFRQIAKITHSLADRWNFTGARTEELLRYALYVLSVNRLTFLEVAVLLANDGYRAELLKNVTNGDVREYFELRFDPLSDAMKATMREPVLNKLTELTGNPHFRYVLGQSRSTISFDDALASRSIVLVNLYKGLLGSHALTFGALVYAKLKAAIRTVLGLQGPQSEISSAAVVRFICACKASECAVPEELGGSYSYENTYSRGVKKQMR